MTIKVNGQKIPEKAVLAELKRLMEFYGQHMPREELGRHVAELVERAKEHAIGTQLLVEEVKRRHIEVTDTDVAGALGDMIKRVGGEDKLTEMLIRQGLTQEQFLASIRVGKQLDTLVSRITSTAPECTEEDLKKYFEDHPERYLAADRAQVRHILMKPASGSEPDKATTRSTLMGFKQKVLEGDDFSDLAAAHSECPSGKEAGGSLGWIARGTTVPEFDQAVFEDLEIGELSDPIETSLGFHMIELSEKEIGDPLPYDEVKEGIRDLLTHERKGKALSEFVAQLREKAEIEETGENDAKQWEGIFDSFLDGQKPS
jgi:parvulin-like peptidyl-prolyl isomerase